MTIRTFQHRPYSLLIISVDQLHAIGNFGEIVKAGVIEVTLHRELEQPPYVGYCLVLNSKLIIASWAAENFVENSLLMEGLPPYLAHKHHGAVIRRSWYPAIVHALYAAENLLQLESTAKDGVRITYTNGNSR